MNTKKSFIIISLATGLAFAQLEKTEIAEVKSSEKDVQVVEEKPAAEATEAASEAADQPSMTDTESAAAAEATAKAEAEKAEADKARALARLKTPVAKATDKLPWPSISSLWYDYKARKALQDKNPELALQYELKVLENEPNSVQTHSNLGIVFDYLQRKDESGQSFDNSLDLLERYKDQLSPADVFQIYYNLGLRFHTAKNTELALEYYQKALEINPSSIETKHNIELLIQQQQGGGQGEGKDKNKNGQGKDNPDQKEGDDKDKKDKDQSQDRQQTSKYKPRPYQGDKLSEADVKKILGELSQQDKKIRANYNKKDRKEDKNAKDW